jgi:hypothetical protein
MLSCFLFMFASVVLTCRFIFFFPFCPYSFELRYEDHMQARFGILAIAGCILHGETEVQ